MSGDGSVSSRRAGEPAPTQREIWAAWWPLSLSWLLMSAEQPAMAAVIARLAAPTIQLAAWGGVVFAFALVIEAPIIMLLAASTELVRDRASYLALRRFTHRAGATLTACHLLLATTPAFEWLMGGVLGVPDEVLAPGRTGLLIVLPWSWSIAWRRFNQGILIRFGRARVVSLGTALRLGTNAAVLTAGYALAGPGVTVAALALASGVVVEAIYAAIAVREVVRTRLDRDDPEGVPLRGRAFLGFYVPLALTPLVTLLVQPLGTAALTRMPDALASLAVWPVLNGLSFVLAAPGLAFNEVVVACWRGGSGRAALRRFALGLCLGSLAIVLVLAATPLSTLWFREVAGLATDLADMAELGLWILVPVAAARAWQSWTQGVLVAERRTTAVSESVVVFAVVSAALLGVFVHRPIGAGLFAGLVAFTVGRLAQTVLLDRRARLPRS